jgi:hypothetical protein
MQVKGVESASLNIQSGKLEITHAPSVTDEALKAAIGRTSFKLVVLNPPSS